MNTLKKVVNNPYRAIRHVLKMFRGRILVRFNGLYQEASTEKIVDDSWDSLIILDACRYDALERENPWDTECRCVISQESNTAPWFKHNFVDITEEQAKEIAYVTGNARVSELVPKDNWFGHLEEVHEYAWDTDIGTVHPDDLTDAALRVSAEHSDKRLVVHYIQPHGPLVGSEDPSISGGKYGPYERLRKGEVSKEYAMEMYSQSLRYALREVDRLVDYLSGTVIVTSDHGECLGEGGLYGHPPGAKSKYLLEVPRIELEGKGSDIPESYLQQPDEIETSDQRQRLKDLGYL